jgi:hypothetical protein
MFGTRNYTSAWAWLPSAATHLFSFLNMVNYDAIQVRPDPRTPASRSHTSPQRPCTNPCLRSPPTCPRRFSHRSHSFFSSLHSHSHSTFQRLFTCIHFWYPGALMYRSHSLPKDSIPIREGAVASLASILGGFGVVALFCSVGVNV